jgi:hypothetical protein
MNSLSRAERCGEQRGQEFGIVFQIGEKLQRLTFLRKYKATGVVGRFCHCCSGAKLATNVSRRFTVE